MRRAMIAPRAIASASATVGWRLASSEKRIGLSVHNLQALPAPPLDLVAEELRLAQNALGEITGAFGADDLLGVIFSRFCIGK